jgi:hypothetical protein
MIVNTKRNAVDFTVCSPEVFSLRQIDRGSDLNRIDPTAIQTTANSTTWPLRSEIGRPNEVKRSRNLRGRTFQDD